MRRFRFTQWIILVIFSSGCFNDGSVTQNPIAWSRLKPKQSMVTPDVVEIHYTFLERNLDDPVINKVIWNEADEHVLGLELKQRLADNGIRVGKLGSRLPDAILKLIETDTSAKQGSARANHTRSGTLVKVPITDMAESWSLFTLTDGRPAGRTLASPQGFLHVTPTIGPGMSVHLTLAPHVDLGESKPIFRPRADLTGFEMQTEKECVPFPELEMNLDVESGTFLLVGCLPERSGTLGANLFLKSTHGRPKQRVMLVRVIRPTREELFNAGYRMDDFFLSFMTQKIDEGKDVDKNAKKLNGHGKTSGDNNERQENEPRTQAEQ